MTAMINKSFIAVATILFLVSSILAETQFVEVADANPTWGTSATPIPPIKDPPQITITSPNSIEYSNPVPLSITIIQPDSWVSKRKMVLPRPWVDNSDNVVAGQNRLISLTCIIDGQSFIIWNSTFLGEGLGVAYDLPRITQFSAVMNVSKGQHNLRVNVLAVSEYVVEGIIPFAGRLYNISASKSTTFTVNSNSDFGLPPKIDNISSSYAIWQSSSPIATPTVPEFPAALALTLLIMVALAVLVSFRRMKTKHER
jgi:hypothetical protein